MNLYAGHQRLHSRGTRAKHAQTWKIAIFSRIALVQIAFLAKCVVRIESISCGLKLGALPSRMHDLLLAAPLVRQ